MKAGANFHFYIFGFHFGNFATFQNLFCASCGNSHGGGIFFMLVCVCHRGYMIPNVV